MIYGKPAGQVTFIGNNHSQISPNLKAWIMYGDVCVCGVIAEGTSRQLQTNWDSPFEGANADGTELSTVASLLQAETGMTTVTQMNSMQLWKGAQPHTIPLVLSFYALRDAKSEVMDAIRYLEMFASTNLHERSPVEGDASFSTSSGVDVELELGRAPEKVIINIGRVAIFSQIVIESVETPLSGPKDIDGNLVSAEVTLNLQTLTAVNRRDISNTFG